MIHKAGASNVIADCLSRLPLMNPEEGKNAAAAAAYVDTSDAFCSVFDDLDLFECYVNLPVMTPTQPTPLDFTWIRQQQQQDNRLQQLAQNNPQVYVSRAFTDTVSLITYVRPGDNPNNEWKICLTQDMLLPMVRWYHDFLGHPGQTRLLETLLTRYHHPAAYSV